MRMEHLNAQYPAHHHQHQSSKRGQNNELIRLYETADTPLVCKTSAVALTLYIVSVVFIPAPVAIDRIAPSEAGRSPPMSVEA
ncbi:MAG: hypothetical protein JOZ62_10545 [Acidobacteriaceae bacterium]|nr:hypothetical protein [Acidobacteriaceae bacterium]